VTKAVLHRNRGPRLLEASPEAIPVRRKVFGVQERIEPATVQLLRPVTRDALDRTAVVQGHEIAIDQRDRVVAVIDERAESGFPLDQRAPEPDTLACVAQRARQELRVRAALHQIILRARLDRRDGQRVIVSRGEHDDRQLPRPPLQFRECLEA
jgi:hypothetical protein